MINHPISKSIQDTRYIGIWKGHSPEIPVYSVTSMHGLNQLVGYVKHINAGNGTVLYRGQCRLHESIIPSIMHEKSHFDNNRERLNEAVNKMVKDKGIREFLHLDNPDIDGWNLYFQIAVEAVLQHYGASTYCVDFVDNHWTALWFGLYKWDSSKNQYSIRNDIKNISEDNWLLKRIDYPLKKEYPTEPPELTIHDLSQKEKKKAEEIARNRRIETDIIIRDFLLKKNKQHIIDGKAKSQLSKKITYK